MAKKKKDNESKCALIMAPCPKTASDLAPLYCPNWVENIPEVEKDGTGMVTAEVFYTGCQLRRQVLYLLSMTASAGQAAASADKSATESRKCMTAVLNLPLVVVTDSPMLNPIDSLSQLLLAKGEGNVQDLG